MPFQKGHKPFKGIEKGWFKKGIIPWSASQKGVHLSPNSEFKKGQQSFNKGKKFPERSGEKSSRWKGHDVGYGGVHQWMKKVYGKAEICSTCGSTYCVHWANLSGNYKRERSDWDSLCIKCHRKLDQWSKKMWMTRKARVS